jgi:hypothetical protein
MKSFCLKALLAVVIIPVVLGCSRTRVWTSKPAVQFADSAYINARFEPLKWGTNINYFNAFRLTITNKTADAIEIDWKNTRYLLNGQPFSPFIWAGIGKENVNDPPPDTVYAGGDFSRIIVPLKLVAWNPIRSGSQNLAFTPGPLMEGRNGIDLIMRQDNQQVKERITVDIKTK